MRVFTPDELERMQGAQAQAMMDQCDLLIKFKTDRIDEYGHPISEWVTAATLACGLDLRASREMINAEAYVYDARLRLPIDTLITRIDRVRVTHRYGVLLETALDFDLVGEPRRGPSGLLMDLRTVTLEAR